jgi:hypothetical protein
VSILEIGGCKSLEKISLKVQEEVAKREKEGYVFLKCSQSMLNVGGELKVCMFIDFAPPSHDVIEVRYEGHGANSPPIVVELSTRIARIVRVGHLVTSPGSSTIHRLDIRSGARKVLLIENDGAAFSINEEIDEVVDSSLFLTDDGKVAVNLHLDSPIADTSGVVTIAFERLR